MKRVFAGLVIIIAAFFLAPAVAGATTIPAGCGTCGAHNTSWTITYAPVLNDPAGPNANRYQLFVTATYGANTDFHYIDSIAFKFNAAGQSAYENGTPALEASGDGGPWQVLFGGVNSGGCSGSGNGFWCANSVGPGAYHSAAGETDIWVFLLDLKKNVQLADAAAGAFKAEFTQTANGPKVGSLLSESITITRLAPTGLIPEPATLLLVGTGLGWAVRRRRQARASVRT